MILNKIFKKIPGELKKGMTVYYKKGENIWNELEEFKIRKYYSAYEKKIKQFENIHKGERCFIIGTGPSLNKTNLGLIKNEIIIGVNELYRFNSIKFDYFVVGGGTFFQKYIEDLFNLDITLFLPTKPGIIYLKNIKYNQKRNIKANIIPIKCKGFNNVSNNLLEGTYRGGTVTNQCLQIANYMGFKEVYLLGCDCDYSGKPHFDGSEILVSDIISKENDWSIPFNMYRLNKELYESQGRKIYNATVGGKLEVFERKKLEDVING
jgi:hypothetical protein